MIGLGDGICGMVYMQGYFYSATVCQCYWNFCLRSVCYKNL